MTIAIADDHLIYYPENGDSIKIIFVFDNNGELVGFKFENGHPVSDELHNILMDQLGIVDIAKKIASISEKIGDKIEEEKPASIRRPKY